MDHVAIMKKSWGLIPKILDGTKKIESRWGKNKCAPWGKVKVGDRVYFKNSGEAVTAGVIVSKVMEFNDLTPEKVWSIIKKYGGKDGIASSDLNNLFEWAKEKRYCTLIYLSNVKKLKPFNIDKKGFGTGAAWLSIKDVNTIKTRI